MAEYADKHDMYMKINFVNPDHVHALIDLPTALSIEKLIQLLKGSSSHWVNAGDLITGKFAWARGYGAFSVSQSNVDQVARYIGDQEEHHRVRTLGVGSTGAGEHENAAHIDERQGRHACDDVVHEPGDALGVVDHVLPRTQMNTHT